MNTITDPRPQLAASQAWVAGLIDAVTPEQLTWPTPCDEWDVRALLEHLLAVQGRISGVPRGEDINALPRFIDLPSGDPGSAFRDAAAEAAGSWSDDDALVREVTVPWGTVPGASALEGYVREHLAHGWDLAVATGQNPEADADLAAFGLATAREGVPAEPRGGFVPFEAVVEPAEDAGPTERLANWLGRTTRG